MPLLPSALPPKGEARRYVANDFLNLIALPIKGRHAPTLTLNLEPLIPMTSSYFFPKTIPSALPKRKKEIQESP